LLVGKLEALMDRPEFEFDDSEARAQDAAGTPEGDGDFETDGLPDTNETSAGGQVGPPHDARDGVEGRKQPVEPSGFMKVVDEVITGKIQP
jgi:hypothetical protein